MRTLIASLLLLVPTIAEAQRVVITSPNTVGVDGQPRDVTSVFIRNPDGSIATIGASTGSSGSSGSTSGATEATQLANKQALADLLTAQQATTTAANGSNTRLDTLTTAQSGTTTAVNGSNSRLDALTTAQAATTTAINATNARIDTLNASTAAGALSREDAKVLAGQGYTVSTAIVAVSAGNTLSVELTNPAGSGVNLVMSARVFSNNVIGGQAPLEYIRYAATATFPTGGTPTSVTVSNRLTSGAASTATFRYMMGSTAPSGAISSSGFIPTNGEEKRIKDIVIIAPGSKLLYSVGGAGGGLAATARIAVTFLFYTNAI